MDSEPNHEARTSVSIDEKNVAVPVMPAIPVMATPVLPVEKIRALSFPRGMTEHDELQDIENLGHRYDSNLIPMFEKRASATILEVFYDFWVVAVLGIFMNVHAVSDPAALWSYIGYISLVWFNWFLVGCFDVRYVTDSIFSRVARTLHLGVIVGFGVVAPNYDPTKQNKGTWQCMSLILMVSRLVLVLEYSTILWHIRKFKKGRLPLLAALSFHFVAAMVYLGVSFRFEDGRNSNAYIAWYLLMALEAIIQLGLALYSKVLSFNGTHLAERMTIFTMFILGEGVMVVMDSVVNIVKNNGWTPSTIGVLVAAVGTIYIVFMLYNDWMVGYSRLVNWRQLAWTILHYPFHVFLLLFIKGSAQFMIWWKVTQVEAGIDDKFDHTFDNLNVEYVTSEDVVSSLNKTVQDVWTEYKPVWSIVMDEVDYWFTELRAIDDKEWNIPDDQNTEEFWNTYRNALDYIRIAVVNSVFGNFKIDAIQDLYDAGDLDKLDIHEANAKAYDATTERFYLVFQYVFTCAGLALITMTILYLLIKRQRNSRRVSIFFYIRTAIFFLLGIGMSLVTLLSLDWDNKGRYYLYTPWLLPTLCMVFIVLIILTHIPQPPPAVVLSRVPNPLRKWTGGRGGDQTGAAEGMIRAPTYGSSTMQRLRGFVGGKKTSTSYSASSNSGGGQYSQVHVTEMTMNPGSRHSSGSMHEHGITPPPSNNVAYDPYTWNSPQQTPPVSTQYYGAAGYAPQGQQQQQQTFQQYEQYRPQQPYQQQGQQQQHAPHPGY
ncbi:uncharacterized protein B0I36DRAFT_264985 [Microdochium trichocladiopsis]|uniref:Bacterial low temperature requirement A protein-domain-containing protein n=1 Tax=Microdochium trichocladiopsis TaxID=1682393 RepID=A0A9P9BX37_9PEZI|nr:uncharacterized protein B0I36DRAFT_264985 [Microdochium trichocladiopsis]KAH7035701.1 hypothetical protein B0I36DRAFT_264985 [Microdochium trichocladiopsis]